MALSVGAGLLLAGVSLKVAADAIHAAGPVAAALSLLLGAALFSTRHALLARFGAAHRKRYGECIRQPVESQDPGSGMAIALGNVLDGSRERSCWASPIRDGLFPVALRADRAVAFLTPPGVCTTVVVPTDGAHPFLTRFTRWRAGERCARYAALHLVLKSASC
jgi:hypothetical protein